MITIVEEEKVPNREDDQLLNVAKMSVPDDPNHVGDRMLPKRVVSGQQLFANKLGRATGKSKTIVIPRKRIRSEL